jgi:hypothetical protein
MSELCKNSDPFSKEDGRYGAVIYRPRDYFYAANSGNGWCLWINRRRLEEGYTPEILPNDTSGCTFIRLEGDVEDICKTLSFANEIGFLVKQEYQGALVNLIHNEGLRII